MTRVSSGKRAVEGLVAMIPTDFPVKTCPIQGALKAQTSELLDKDLNAYVQNDAQVLVTRENIIFFTNAYTWTDWFHELPHDGFHVMPYPAVFVCEKEVDLDPTHFPRNNGDMAITAGRSGINSTGLIPMLPDYRLFAEGTKRNALYRNLLRVRNHLLNKGSRSPVRLTEKMYHF